MTRRAVKEASRSAPPPDVACGTCRVALWFAGSPDADRQRAAFVGAHPPGDGHEWVAKLPDDHGDVAMGWTPGSGVPFSGAGCRSGGRSQTTASTKAETGGQCAPERSSPRGDEIAAGQGGSR